jgi:hypothetical protein
MSAHLVALWVAFGAAAILGAIAVLLPVAAGRMGRRR